MAWCSEKPNWQNLTKPVTGNYYPVLNSNSGTNFSHQNLKDDDKLADAMSTAALNKILLSEIERLKSKLNYREAACNCQSLSSGRRRNNCNFKKHMKSSNTLKGEIGSSLKSPDLQGKLCTKY